MPARGGLLGSMQLALQLADCRSQALSDWIDAGAAGLACSLGGCCCFESHDLGLLKLF